MTARTRLSLLWLAALAALGLAAASAAQADVFGPIQLTSSAALEGQRYEQADSAIEPAISANGEYVAFVGTFEGVPGVWRRDLQTGAVAQVARGTATLPSISEDGRYVSFTTDERLVPSRDRNSSPDVYRRDMTLECDPGAPEGRTCEPCPEGAEPESAGCPYAVVSAIDGTDEAPEYQFPTPWGPCETTRCYGSIASGRSAMSADGRFVAFISTAGSDLLGAGEAVPGLQVFVRDMRTHETRLESVAYEGGGPVPLREEGGGEFYGAVYPGGRLTPAFDGELTPEWLGASISANGSAVAWMGQNIGEQARLLSGEQHATSAQLTEPLWRPAEAGSQVPTRRVTGGSDPERPGCAESGETDLAGGKEASPNDPCAGPFGLEPDLGVLTNPYGNFVPQMSADGKVVAFLGGADDLSTGEHDSLSEEGNQDLYVVNMSEGLSRVQALQRITERDGLGSALESIAKSATVADDAVSADGEQIAFTTMRTQYPLLGSLSYVSAAAASPGMTELFDADLATGTLTRVTHGFEGPDAPSEQPHPEETGDPYGQTDGAFYPSFADEGTQLSFSSTASNLVFGDGNDASDTFLVTRLTFPDQPVAQQVSPPPEQPKTAPPWKLGGTWRARANGSVVLSVTVPGAGSLDATARSAVKVVATSHSSARRGRASVVTRAVASARATPATEEEGLATLTLMPSRAYLPLAGRHGGLAATVTVTFSAPGHRALRLSVRVTFHLAAHKTSRGARSKP